MEPTQNEDYSFVTIGKKSLPIPYVLFGIGVLILVLLFVYGNVTEGEGNQDFLIWVSLFAIGVSIFWTARKRFMCLAVGFLILLTIYFISGLVVGWLGSDLKYSYGVVTFIIIGAFTMWVSLDSKINMNNVAKIVLFTITTYVINESGWLQSVNEIAASYFSGGVPI